MIKWVQTYRLPVIPLVCLCTVLFACQSGHCVPCDTAPPAESEAPTCPPVPEIASLDDLDAATRARFRSELEREIRHEMMAQWRQEFNREIEASAEALFQKPAKADSPVQHAQLMERDADGIKVLRIVLASNVIRRLPVDERDRFSVTDASVFCYAEVSVPREEERNLTFRFTHSTGLSQSYQLPVNQSPAWRTWSKLNLTKSMTGSWTCEIFNEDQVLLASHAFVVEE